MAPVVLFDLSTSLLHIQIFPFQTLKSRRPNPLKGFTPLVNPDRSSRANTRYRQIPVRALITTLRNRGRFIAMASTKIAKLWVNHLSMTGDLSTHIAYLVNGHQLNADEQARVWTKSLPKGCKDDKAALIAHWRGVHERFIDERSTPGGMVHHNAKVTGRQFVINLPNDITADQVHQLAKVVLRDFPRHIPVSMVLHRTSNRGKEHTHLQGLFSYRNGGYGSIVEDFRLNITGLMKATVTRELSGFGYRVDQGRPSGIGSKERRWLNAQGTVEQRRNPRFMTALAEKATSPRLQAYCIRQADRMCSRINPSGQEDETSENMSTMELLIATSQQETMNTAQDQSGTGRARGTSQPLTSQQLNQELMRARRWKQTLKRDIRSI